MMLVTSEAPRISSSSRQLQQLHTLGDLDPVAVCYVRAAKRRRLKRCMIYRSPTERAPAHSKHIYNIHSARRRWPAADCRCVAVGV